MLTKKIRELEDYLSPAYSGSGFRKSLLASVGILRRNFHLLADERSRKAVGVMEKWAEGKGTIEEWTTALAESYAALPILANGVPIPPITRRYHHVARAVHTGMLDVTNGWKYSPFRTILKCTFEAGFTARRIPAPPNYDYNQFNSDPQMFEREFQLNSDILFDVGWDLLNKFIPDPSWLTWENGRVQRIAEAIYEEDRFEEIPVLADALEEAGCVRREIIDHCRNGKIHVKGCGVIDLILNKKTIQVEEPIVTDFDRVYGDGSRGAFLIKYRVLH